MIIFISLLKCFGQEVTWNMIKEKALENNPLIHVSKNELESSQYNVKSNYLAFVPQINISTNSLQTKFENNPSAKNYNFGFRVSQNIFSGFSDWSKLKVNENQVLINKQDIQNNKNIIYQKLYYAYIDLLYTQELVEINRLLKERRKENMKLVELRFLGGRENKGSLLRSIAFFDQSRFDLKMAKDANFLAQKQISLIINDNIDDHVSYYSKDNFQYFIENRIKADEDVKNKNFKEIIQNNPNLKIADLLITQTEWNIVNKRSQLLPRLDLFWNHEYNDTKYLPKEKNWSISLNLSYPLPTNNGMIYSYSISKVAKIKADYNRIYVRNNLENSLQEKIYNLKYAQKKLSILLSFYEASEVNAQVARAKYSNGLMDYQGWDIFENELFSRKRGLLDGVKNLAYAHAEWVYARGSIKD